MPIEFLECCDTIEESYEFFLAYAGQGLPGDAGSQRDAEIRGFLERTRQALSSLTQSCRRAILQNELQPAEKYEAFCSVLEQDARAALAAVDIVLAQASISSQLIDNLNASGHLRALLTDVFLISEIFESVRKQATPSRS